MGNFKFIILIVWFTLLWFFSFKVYMENTDIDRLSSEMNYRMLERRIEDNQKLLMHKIDFRADWVNYKINKLQEE